MNPNSVFIVGELDPTKKEQLQTKAKKLWGTLVTGGGLTHVNTLEFLPLELKGESPLFIMVAQNFTAFSDGEIPNYKKVSESKNNCRTCVILQERENPVFFGTEDNKPDFFFNIDTNELFFP